MRPNPRVPRMISSALADVGDVGDRLCRRSADQLALPRDALQAGVRLDGGFHHGLGGRERAVDVRLVGAATAPRLGDLPGVDEVELAVRADALDGARECNMRGRRAVEADDDAGMGSGWAVIARYLLVGNEPQSYALRAPPPSGTSTRSGCVVAADVNGCRRWEPRRCHDRSLLTHSPCDDAAAGPARRRRQPPRDRHARQTRRRPAGDLVRRSRQGRARDRRRPDRARRATGRPRRHPRQHASRMDDRRLRGAVRRRHRRADLPHQLARGMPVRAGALRRDGAHLRGPRAAGEDRDDPLRRCPRSSTCSRCSRSPGRRRWTTCARPAIPATSRPSRWRRTMPRRSSTPRARPGRRRGACSRTPTASRRCGCTRTGSATSCKPGVVIFMFLPLAHVLARVVQLVTLDVGATLAFWQGDPKRLLDDIADARPMYLPSVPRVFEKIHARALGAVEDASPVRRRVFEWAVGTGARLRAAERRGETAGPVLRAGARHRRPPRAVPRARAVRRRAPPRPHRGGPDRPRGARVLRRLRRAGARGLRDDGDLRGRHAQHAGRRPPRDRRPPAARQRGRDRRGRRDPHARAARVRRLPPRRGRDGGDVRRRLAAVGRPGGDRRATASSPSRAARRTSSSRRAARTSAPRTSRRRCARRAGSRRPSSSATTGRTSSRC